MDLLKQALIKITKYLWYMVNNITVLSNKVDWQKVGTYTGFVLLLQI